MHQEARIVRLTESSRLLLGSRSVTVFVQRPMAIALLLSQEGLARFCKRPDIENCPFLLPARYLQTLHNVMNSSTVAATQLISVQDSSCDSFETSTCDRWSTAAKQSRGSSTWCTNQQQPMKQAQSTSTCQFSFHQCCCCYKYCSVQPQATVNCTVNTVSSHGQRL